jgi:hypothetical protein
MTSELRVDNLKGSTTGGSINVLGEGTSATTNLQQGLAKAWCQFNQDSTQAFRDSLNMATITDNATGDSTLTYTNNMNNTTYAFVQSGSQQIGTAAGHCSYQTDDQSTSQSNKFRSVTSDGNQTVFDAESIHAALLGDLA